MSKYSAKDKISKKLEDSIAQTNAPLTEKDDLTPDEIAKLTPEELTLPNMMKLLPSARAILTIHIGAAP